MKIQKKLTAALAALLIILNSFPLSVQAAGEAPAFHATIEYSFEGYIVKGTFTEFTPDITFIQPLYSPDGKNYQVCGEDWDLRQLGTEDEYELAKLQNQICLYSNQEPLKSYLAEKTDCFYIKLRITREGGITYETKPAVIDRGTPQPIPEGITPGAKFSSDMAVFETRPFSYYGRYQLTISENTTAEELSSYLPDTLPVEIDLQTDGKPFTDGIVNCPVTWKPLSLPRLTAGESVTIADAAEKIVVPKGTQVTTPAGIFQLDEPLNVDQYAPADEVRLVLNVISEDENPTGILSEEIAGLEMSFHLKPTGATAIRAYTFSEGDSEWAEIPDLSLSEAVNAQPSAKNSGYTLVLHNTLEPYRSYREADTAGTPFFVGLKIEGGVYNGKQLILAWPDTYDSPVKLPDLGGSGGNHNNAGTGNENNSTESGQRPNLPQTNEIKTQTTTIPDDTENKQQPDLPQNTTAEPETPNGVSRYEIPLTQKGGNTLQSYTPFLQFSTVAQVQTGSNVKGRYPDSTANVKTSSPVKLTASASLPSESKVSSDTSTSDTLTSDTRVSSNKEDNADTQEIPDRTAKSKYQELLLPVAVLAAVSLCIVGICFAASSGKISEKNHILRRFLPHR